MDIKNRMEMDLEKKNLEISPKFPKKMLLEVTNMCNHSCLFCANSKMTRKKGVIDFDFACNILKEAYRNGTREVGFYATGEPLIYKDLGKLISFSKAIGYEYTYLTTNGALFSKGRIEEILLSGVDSIKFSINAPDRHLYEIIHGKDDFDKVISNIIAIDEYRKEHRLPLNLYVSYIKTKYTENDDGLKEKIAPYVDDIVVMNCMNQCGVMYEINKYLIPQKESEDDYLMDGSDICINMFNTLYVSYEGYLTMCCTDFQNYLAVADLRKERIEDAWNNKYAQELRKKQLERNLEGTMCFNCRNNCLNNMFPLRPEFATQYDVLTWNKAEEIERRLEGEKK